VPDGALTEVAGASLASDQRFSGSGAFRSGIRRRKEDFLRIIAVQRG
jgi:hypothetical protein